MDRSVEREGDARVWPRRLCAAAGGVLVAALLALALGGATRQQVEELSLDGGERGVERLLTPPTTAAPAPAPPPAPVATPLLPPESAAPPPPLVAPADPAAGAVGAGGVALAGGGAGSEVAVPVASSSVVPAEAPGRRVWALVVGIDDYPGDRYDLRSATVDAADMVSALLRLGVPADQVLALYDGRATADRLLAGIEWLVANAGPEDTVVFLYAGHIRDLGRGTEAMVTAESGWITDWFLADRFAGLRSRDAWFVLAGCYGGGFDELLAPGRILTAAAGPDDLAYESDAYGRSYLAEFVLRQGLIEGQAGEPTVQNAVGWASAQLAERHPSRQIWHRDLAGHPVSLDGVRRGDEAPPPPPPPPPPAPGGGVIGAILSGGGSGGGDSGGSGSGGGSGGSQSGSACILGLLGTCRDD